MKKISTFAAKCADCGQSFSHPSLGDFSYGEVILTTADGKQFATANAFDEFPQRVATLAGTDPFWPVLASLADPIAGQGLKHSIHCPHCGSDRLKYWDGNKTGTMSVPAATFIAAASLSDESLTAHIAAVGHHVSA